jgi:hypothetical protein
MATSLERVVSSILPPRIQRSPTAWPSSAARSTDRSVDRPSSAPISGVPLHLRSAGQIEAMFPAVSLELGRIKYLPVTFIVRGTLESMVSNLPLLDEAKREVVAPRDFYLIPRIKHLKYPPDQNLRRPAR